jgi:hypothetical protein
MFPELYLASKWSQLLVTGRFAEEHNIRANTGDFGPFITISPSLEDIIRARDFSQPIHFTFTRHFEEVANSPFVVLHLENGHFVKANYSWISSFDPCHQDAGSEVKATVLADFKGKRVVNAIPPYHVCNPTHSHSFNHRVQAKCISRS